MNRRFFIKSGGLALGSIPSFRGYPAGIFSGESLEKLTILYTNDVHSRIDSFPADHPQFPLRGGFAPRAAIVESIRKKVNHVLLLDAGDMFQGTPYFNFYGGEAEFRLMSKMGYDCVTLGNHDFDNGVNGLADKMKFADFSFVNCNYQLADTPIHNRVRVYKIFRRGQLKVGVFGLGIDLEGLVNANLRKGVIYGDPLLSALNTERHLKEEMGCDLIICLSHLGYAYKETKWSDTLLAPELLHTALIIGGHTHTFLAEPVKFVNKSGKPIYVTQTGWGGINLGRFDFLFDESRQCSGADFSMYKISIKTTVG
jgi:5'-nucleotidase